ncbi:MAG: bifunctional precorrin-2 dehydrogenase/sirohydrochlorin ferrochelatase [Firmicutes bacterium]|nr:bifunctional precorrin-2 dehydrogenase/sirohydrochlorin ferrochelatase [Bacillota bacterium]
MGYFPVMLDVTRRPVVVVGSGAEAVAKIARLREAEATVHVFDQRPDCPLPEPMRSEVQWHARWPTRGDVEEAALVILAHEDAAVNQRLRRDMRQAARLIYVVDEPASSDCIMVSHLRRGPLVVSVSTSGYAPGMARRVREALEPWFDDRWPMWLEALRQVRDRARLNPDRTQRRRIIQEAEEHVWEAWDPFAFRREREKPNADRLPGGGGAGQPGVPHREG